MRQNFLNILYFNGHKGCVSIRNISDYSPFGVLLSERTTESAFYRKGFQGQERDDEVSGEGNIYEAPFWKYSSRLARRWNIDPVIKEYESPYACFSNNPICFKDPNGADTINIMSTLKEYSGKNAFKDLISGSSTFSNFFLSFTSNKSNSHIKLEFALTNNKGIKGQSDIYYKGKDVRTYLENEIPKDANISDFSIHVALNPEITINPNSTNQGASNQLDRTTTLNHELMVHSTTQANFINTYYNSISKTIDGEGLFQAVNLYYDKDSDHELLTNKKALLYNASSKEIVEYIKMNNPTRMSGSWESNPEGTIKKEMPYWMALEIYLEFEKKR